jgi:predicted dehydrogenase
VREWIAPGMVERVKSIGLVGCGGWGANILRDLILLDCGVHVADIDPAARAKATGAGAVAVYPDSGALPECDGYVVAVPIPDLAVESARLLARRGPVFSEKTLCRSPEDHEKLKALGGSERLFVMHKWHYHPGIEELRRIAASGRIGALEELSTTRHAWVKDFHGGDVFWTQAVHDLTIVKHILGYIPGDVTAVDVIEDEEGLPVSLIAKLGSDPTVSLSVSGRNDAKVSGVIIRGSRGTAELAGALDDHVLMMTEQGQEKVPIDTTYPLYLELREFVEYLDGGPRPRCDLESAREVMEALLMLRENARARRGPR